MKFCKDCKHSVPVVIAWSDLYASPQTETACGLKVKNTNLVTGLSSYETAKDERGENGDCGQEGKNFQQQAHWFIRLIKWWLS